MFSFKAERGKQYAKKELISSVSSLLGFDSVLLGSPRRIFFYCWSFEMSQVIQWEHCGTNTSLLIRSARPFEHVPQVVMQCLWFDLIHLFLKIINADSLFCLSNVASTVVLLIQCSLCRLHWTSQAIYDWLQLVGGSFVSDIANQFFCCIKIGIHAFGKNDCQQLLLNCTREH